MGATGFDDSKKLTEETRERMFEEIKSSEYLGWNVIVLRFPCNLLPPARHARFLQEPFASELPASHLTPKRCSNQRQGDFRRDAAAGTLQSQRHVARHGRGPHPPSPRGRRQPETRLCPPSPLLYTRSAVGGVDTNQSSLQIFVDLYISFQVFVGLYISFPPAGLR
jgi:hypothetical protein